MRHLADGYPSKIRGILGKSAWWTSWENSNILDGAYRPYPFAADAIIFCENKPPGIISQVHGKYGRIVLCL